MSALVDGRVVRRHEWAPGLMTLTIAAEVRPFVAGQFFNIGLPDDAGEPLRRAYSAASAPSTSTLEFYLNEVPNGAFTPRLFRLRENDRIFVDPNPQGFFTFAWLPPAEELWMIGTGTGLGPYISMLRSGDALSRFSRTVLVHGVRHAQELGYAAELRALAEREEGRFAYVPVVSREAVAGTLSGRVTSALERGELEASAELPLTPERSHVMLCGNPAMIDDMLALLAARGLKRHRTRKPGHVTVERYWENESS